MTAHFSRRQFLAASAASTGAMLMTTSAAADGADVLKPEIITSTSEPYAGWSTVTRRKNGQLVLVWSGGREGHVCPFGQVRMMTSNDEGKTWTWPRVILDGPIDDRDAGALETPQGTLLVTSFSSLAYEPALKKAEESGEWPAERLTRWQAARDRLSAEERQQMLGTWMIRSTDGGLNWSGRYDCQVSSPHGPIALADGRLLHAGKQLWKNDKRNGVVVSSDDGVSWTWLADIPTRSGDNPIHYHELHAVQTPTGRIVVQIRNHNQTSNHETLQTESDDGGQTWSEPHSIGVWGFPSHLLRLKNGDLLMSYGHRRAPIGNQARFSSDNGQTWGDAVILSDDATSTDLGYPSTVELSDGSLLTIWYEKVPNRSGTVLRQARWTRR